MEGSVRDRLYARCDVVLKALAKTKLSEFTVSQLHDLMLLVTNKPADEPLARLEAFIAEQALVFKHGMKVRYKNAPRSKRGLGTVTSHPRKGSQIVHVRGPQGWAGWARVNELEIVRATGKEGAA